MKKFIVTNGQITINNVVYISKTIDISSLTSKKLKYTDGSNVNNEKGVYIFVSENDIPAFDINFFNKEVTGIFFKNNCPFVKAIGVPPYNEFPQKDCVFYVGSTNEIVFRMKEHWKNDEVNGCASLKLGFSSRKWINLSNNSEVCHVLPYSLLSSQL